mmetsp:Transcript_10408/g.24790  ORF Transcript_10408/g.24790 Transcript_10408/m.24790 type:complete len:200 (+) Transcript_10408:70-669(+)
MSSEGGDEAQAAATLEVAAKECVACKKKNPAAWSGGPKGRKIRKGTPLLPSYGWPAWCCNLKPCQRDCGFIEDRAAKAAELQSVYRPSDNEYLSEMISIRGTRFCERSRMVTRGEQRNETDDKEIEYQVFGVFKSSEKEPDADSGDKDHQWMALKEMYEALNDRELIDGMVTTYFASLLPAHTTAMDAIVEQATGDDAP